MVTPERQAVFSDFISYLEKTSWRELFHHFLSHVLGRLQMPQR
jgi:hypothetical protein